MEYKDYSRTSSEENFEEFVSFSGQTQKEMLENKIDEFVYKHFILEDLNDYEINLLDLFITALSTDSFREVASSFKNPHSTFMVREIEAQVLEHMTKRRPIIEIQKYRNFPINEEEVLPDLDKNVKLGWVGFRKSTTLREELLDMIPQLENCTPEKAKEFSGRFDDLAKQKYSEETKRVLLLLKNSMDAKVYYEEKSVTNSLIQKYIDYTWGGLDRDAFLKNSLGDQLAIVFDEMPNLDLKMNLQVIAKQNVPDAMVFWDISQNDQELAIAAAKKYNSDDVFQLLPQIREYDPGLFNAVVHSSDDELLIEALGNSVFQLAPWKLPLIAYGDRNELELFNENLEAYVWVVDHFSDHDSAIKAKISELIIQDKSPSFRNGLLGLSEEDLLVKIGLIKTNFS